MKGVQSAPAINRATDYQAAQSTVTTPDAVDRGGGIADRLPRVWTLWAATRPSQVALVLAVYLLGVGMGTTGPPITDSERAASISTVVLAPEFFAPVLLGAIGLVLVTVAIHYANEYTDVETDRLTTPTPFSGGSGALVRTGLSRSFMRSATIAAVVVASMSLLALATVRGVPVDAIGLLVVIFGLGLAYSLPPIAFIRRGLGELVNAILGGVLLPLYGTAVVASPTPAAVLAVLPFALLVICNLFATHWPDREADARVGKRTLAVRWSPRRLRRAFGVVATLALSVAAGLWIVDVLPTAVALAHVTPVPFLLWSGIVLTRQRSPFPAVFSMVVLAIASTIAWWWVGVGV